LTRHLTQPSKRTLHCHSPNSLLHTSIALLLFIQELSKILKNVISLHGTTSALILQQNYVKVLE